MKNICRTVADFLENLRIELDNSVITSSSDVPDGQLRTVDIRLCPIHRKSIFLSQFSEHIGDDKRNAVRFNAIVAVSAVIATEEGEYLLECTENMGIDYRDSTNEREGSEKAALVVAKIKEFCQTNGLTIRPGSVSY